MEDRYEYIVIMLDCLDIESYEYFTNKQKAIKYAKEMSKEYSGVCVKMVDYEENTEEFIWESGE